MNLSPERQTRQDMEYGKGIQAWEIGLQGNRPGRRWGTLTNRKKVSSAWPEGGGSDEGPRNKYIKFI